MKTVHLTALFICLAMLFTLLPASALADEELLEEFFPEEELLLVEEELQPEPDPAAEPGLLPEMPEEDLAELTGLEEESEEAETLCVNGGNGLIDGITPVAGGTLTMGGIEWRVIGKSDAAWLVIANDVLGSAMPWAEAIAYGNETVYASLFSDAEKAAVLYTSKTEEEAYSFHYECEYWTADFGPASIGGNLFLLSAEEAVTYFGTDGERTAPGGADWWLRSPFEKADSGAGLVVSIGMLDINGVEYENAVRPAFRLDPGKVGTVEVSAGAGGTCSGSGIYITGTTLELKAEPAEGYLFDGWYDGEELVSEREEYSFAVVGDVTLTAKFLEKKGVVAFLLRCYEEGLGRSEEEVLRDDLAGLRYWYGVMKNALLTPAQVANYFALSGESQVKYDKNGDYVAMLYRLYMDRSYEKAGYAYWLGLLDGGTLTREQVNCYFGISPEFQSIVNGFGLG